MAVYKEPKTNTWRVIYRYTDWNGERKQSQKRGFQTKREAQSWEREQLGTDDVLLALPGAVLDAAAPIFLIMLHKASEGHIQIGTQFVKLFPLPALCLSFCLKATLLGLLPFSVPICVPINDPPSVGFRFLINCQCDYSFLPAP